MYERILALFRRPTPRVVEDKDRSGIYELWFGGWLLTGGTNRESLEHQAALMRS